MLKPPVTAKLQLRPLTVVFFIFGLLKRLTFYLLLLCTGVRAQDRVLFTNGQSRNGLVLQLWPDFVIVDFEGKERKIKKKNLLLIEFADGSVQTFSRPNTDVVVDTSGKGQFKTTETLSYQPTDLISVNSLAVSNSDISLFYEKLVGNRVGAGVMGAYNFNRSATLLNVYMAGLPAARKQFDLGAFVNFYFEPPHEPNQTALYTGAMIKYMQFSFSKIVEINPSSGGATQIHYVPTQGKQLCPMLIGGTHSSVNGKFFIHTIVGLGLFQMKGSYLQQFNYAVFGNTGTVSRSRLLFEAYLGLNIGFSF